MALLTPSRILGIFGMFGVKLLWENTSAEPKKTFFFHNKNLIRVENDVHNDESST